VVKRAGDDGAPSRRGIVTALELARADGVREHRGAEDAAEEQDEGMRDAGAHRELLEVSMKDGSGARCY
jgi:hypothetical protein